MTIAGSRDAVSDGALAGPTSRSRRLRSVGRLVRLYITSRRIPAAILLMVGSGAVFRGVLQWQGGHNSLQVPLIVEAAASAIVAVGTASPFGESEGAAGRRLPYLRLGTGVGLTVSAFAALFVSAVGANILGGTLALLRDVAGIAGIGLLDAAVLGTSFSWIGPMAFLALAEEALSSGWHSPWIWPARPPDDLGGALCAGLVFIGGLAVITVCGARTFVRE